MFTPRIINECRVWSG